MEVVGILGVDDLEEYLLDISLVGLILHDLAELDSVNFCRNESLHFIEETFLLGEDWLEYGGDLRGLQYGVELGVVVDVVFLSLVLICLNSCLITTRTCLLLVK